MLILWLVGSIICYTIIIICFTLWVAASVFAHKPEDWLLALMSFFTSLSIFFFQSYLASKQTQKLDHLIASKFGDLGNEQHNLAQLIDSKLGGFEKNIDSKLAAFKGNIESILDTINKKYEAQNENPLKGGLNGTQ